MRLLYFLKIALSTVVLGATTSLGPVGSEPLPPIKVQGHQLLVDGKPFVMKGVCYNPVTKGGTYPENLITQNPTAADLAIIKKDFEMMHAAGINTVRPYAPLLDKRILKLLDDNQLKAIIPIRSGYSISASTVSATVSALQNERSTLIWEIGNECNLNHFYTDTVTNPQGINSDQLATFITTTASIIKNLDSAHLVSVDLGVPQKGEPFVLPVDNSDIDLYGLNLYYGSTCGPLYTIWPQISNKPLYLSEFGATAYNLGINGVQPDASVADMSIFVTWLDRYYLFGELPSSFLYTNNCPGAVIGGAVFGEDENAQADGITALVADIQSHLSANNPHNILAGGCIFEWTDEWWKAPWKNGAIGLSLHSIDGPPCPDKEGFANYGPYPDHFFHEEWFGLLTVDHLPRAAYFALQRLYSKQP